tara:strand:+ start:231 stop:770 length:540 start_codon:yes stop_codon:yes gene_type:complete
MITVKYKKNFDIDRMIRNVRASSAVLLNDIAKTVKEGWDTEIKQNSFTSLSSTTTSLHGSHRPLNLSGKLAKSNRIVKATTKRLKAKVHNTAKSSTNYKIRKPNGKVQKGTRKSAPVFYGYYQNKGFKTAPDSLIPNRKVPKRDFTSKTVDNLEKNPKYIKAKRKFANNLEKSMKMASK